jgi:hypothetical protein
MTRGIVRRLVRLTLTGAAAAGAYVFILRPWMMEWGATKDEIARPLPGDDYILQPKTAATHVVTIAAAPEEIWPWLVQIGQGRGGFYTYDWLENLADLQIHSADHILPAFQQLKVGDVIPLEPHGTGPTVAVLEPQKALVLHWSLDARTGQPPTQTTPEADLFKGSWTFVLDPIAPGKTRLIERWRANYPLDGGGALFRAFLEPMAFIMERGMLLGVKQRVEAEHERIEEAISTL